MDAVLSLVGHVVKQFAFEFVLFGQVGWHSKFLRLESTPGWPDRARTLKITQTFRPFHISACLSCFYHQPYFSSSSQREKADSANDGNRTDQAGV